jgi:hypothetical protein
VRTHEVNLAVANFGATRIGDTVTINLEDQLTFVLSGAIRRPHSTATSPQLRPAKP